MDTLFLSPSIYKYTRPIIVKSSFFSNINDSPIAKKQRNEEHNKDPYTIKKIKKMLKIQMV